MLKIHLAIIWLVACRTPQINPPQNRMSFKNLSSVQEGEMDFVASYVSRILKFYETFKGRMETETRAQMCASMLPIICFHEDFSFKEQVYKMWQASLTATNDHADYPWVVINFRGREVRFEKKISRYDTIDARIKAFMAIESDGFVASWSPAFICAFVISCAQKAIDGDWHFDSSQLWNETLSCSGL